MAIAKTASRSVAFKAVKIAESAVAGQSEVLTREVARVDVPTDEEALDFWMTWGVTRIYTLFIRTTQIAGQ